MKTPVDFIDTIEGVRAYLMDRRSSLPKSHDLAVAVDGLALLLKNKEAELAESSRLLERSVEAGEKLAVQIVKALDMVDIVLVEKVILRTLVVELRHVLSPMYQQSPEGRAYLEKIDEALSAKTR